VTPLETSVQPTPCCQEARCKWTQ